MNTYNVEITKSRNWYSGLVGQQFTVYRGRKIYMLKDEYDAHADTAPVRGIEFSDCKIIQKVQPPKLHDLTI